MGHLTRGRENINKSPVADGKTVYDEWLSYCERTMLNICWRAKGCLVGLWYKKKKRRKRGLAASPLNHGRWNPGWGIREVRASPGTKTLRLPLSIGWREVSMYCTTLCLFWQLYPRWRGKENVLSSFPPPMHSSDQDVCFWPKHVLLLHSINLFPRPHWLWKAKTKEGFTNVGSPNIVYYILVRLTS